MRFRLQSGLLAILLLTVVGVRASEASPIAWLFTGSVVSSFNDTLVPVGSPATMLLTVDPDANLELQNTAPHPPSAGAYYFSLVFDFTGREYTDGGAFEINWDLTFGQPIPGAIRLVDFGVHGPSLVPGSPSYSPYSPCLGPFCGSQIGSTDPTSPAFPGPFLTGFTLHFQNPAGGNDAVVLAVGNPQVVPEPTTLLLLGTGLAAVVGRRVGSARRRHANNV